MSSVCPNWGYRGFLDDSAPVRGPYGKDPRTRSGSMSQLP